MRFLTISSLRSVVTLISGIRSSKRISPVCYIVRSRLVSDCILVVFLVCIYLLPTNAMETFSFGFEKAKKQGCLRCIDTGEKVQTSLFEYLVFFKSTDLFTQIFSIFPQYRPYYSNIQYLATVHTYLLKYSMFYESRGCLLTYLVLGKQNRVESPLFKYSRISRWTNRKRWTQ